MRMIIITSAYQQYLEMFYKEHPELENRPYNEQKEVLNHDAFGWADFWSRAMEPLGYEILEIIPSATYLQLAWAKENGISISAETDINDIVVEQVKKYKPEVIWFNNFDGRLLEQIRSAASNIRLVIGGVGSAIPDTKIWRDIDVVISCAPESVERLRSMGVRAEKLNHAFNPLINPRLKHGPKKFTFSFVGQLVRENQYHLQRENLLEKLASQIRINIFSPSADFTRIDESKALIMASSYLWMQVLKAVGIPVSALQNLPIIGKAASWKSRPLLPVNRKLKPFINPAVFGLKMFQTLRDSELVYNIHADSSPLYASNMRLFETTGVGTCLVTDWKVNLREFFVPEKEVVTYKTADECLEKVKWLIDHPREREEIAKAGQDRTLKDHTYGQRSLDLDAIIKRELA